MSHCGAGVGLIALCRASTMTSCQPLYQASPNSNQAEGHFGAKFPIVSEAQPAPEPAGELEAAQRNLPLPHGPGVAWSTQDR